MKTISCPPDSAVGDYSGTLLYGSPIDRTASIYFFWGGRIFWGRGRDKI